MSPLYLYAVIDEEPAEPLGAGLAGEPLRLVRCGELLIVAGEAEPKITPENLAAQDAVVRRLNVPAVLPIRFGETVRDEEELCNLLKPRGSDLVAALERVRGCEQMTLRVFGEPSPPPPAPSEPSGPGTRYMEARRREIERARSLPEVEPLLDRLRPLVQAERIERKEQGALLGTVYHLVRREDVPAYKETVREEDGVAVSGPWPPYAFAPGLGDPT
ncbi:MAG TPA: GvpL/GvpF family gas vesicle protein [Thermoanaerobaculia bacterium]|nr:GvpL/GvpF family gas vesicle protein [Thermoanaerobaculia bacterium]